MGTVKIDYSALGRAAAKALVNAAVGNWPAVLVTIIDSVAAIDGKASPEELAAQLVRRALVRAVAELVREEAIDHDVDAARFETALGDGLVGAEFTLEPGIGERPHTLPLLVEASRQLKAMLVTSGLAPARAASLARRLPSYFAVAFDEEWRGNRLFDSIPALARTAATPQAERELAWRRYAATLRHQAAARLFGESFCLRDVYIPPRAYVVEGSCGRRPDPEAAAQETRRVLDTRAAIRTWLEAGDPHDPVRVISGGPGAGKSSFALMLATDIADDHKVLLVPLSRIDPRRELAAEIDGFVGRHLPHNPLDPRLGDERLLLILDGLDELEMAGRNAHEVVRDFVAQVRATLARLNEPGRLVQVLLCGRELVVQAVEAEFRGGGRVLHLLPYVVDKEKYEDPDGLLAEDLRDAWWRRYAAATGQEDTGLPPALAQGKLGEVTAQPLLNYLVAKTVERGTVAIDDTTNINEIYADLVQAVHERRHAGRQGHPLTRHIDLDDFFEMLEEIALAAWHGNGRTVTEAEVRAYARRSRIEDLFESMARGGNDGIARLMLAFYFRPAAEPRQDGHKTFEFTHKSFGEYLTARRLVRALDRIHGRLFHGDRRERWTGADALGHWVEICGPTELDMDLYEFLEREIALRGDASAVAWQQDLAGMIGACCRESWPITGLPFATATRHARHAEEALFAAAEACAETSQAFTTVEWPSDTAFHDSLQRLGRATQGGRLYIGNLDLSGCTLDSASLPRNLCFDARLSGVTASYVTANGAAFLWSSLADTRLNGACLAVSHFQGCDLTRADLRGADVTAAYFFGCDLSHARFDGARLDRATLRNCRLTGLDLDDLRRRGAIIIDPVETVDEG